MSVNQQDSEQVCKVIWVIANHHFTRRAKRPRPKIAAALYRFQERKRESEPNKKCGEAHAWSRRLPVRRAGSGAQKSLSLTLFLCLVRFSERDVRSFRLKVEGVSARE